MERNIKKEKKMTMILNLEQKKENKSGTFEKGEKREKWKEKKRRDGKKKRVTFLSNPPILFYLYCRFYCCCCCFLPALRRPGKWLCSFLEFRFSFFVDTQNFFFLFLPFNNNNNNNNNTITQDVDYDLQWWRSHWHDW